MGVPERVVRRSEELLARSLLSQNEKESAKGGNAGGARPTPSEGDLPAAVFEEGDRYERAALSGPRRVSRGTDRNQNQNPSDAWTLDALRGVLAETAADALGSSSFDPSTSFGVIGAGESPPASAGAWTCVYVLKRADGWAYCGETDDLAGRLSAHRRSAARDGRRAGTTTAAAVECTFFRVPREAGGKSAARAVEQRVIERLKHMGAPLLSDADAKNASFGSASERL
jgi:predicted GIY-YIG superfamily endonuclease